MISDVLSDAVAQIREYQAQDQTIDPTRDPAVDLVCAIMDAVRVMPGRDRLPDAPNTFTHDLGVALSDYARSFRASHAGTQEGTGTYVELDL